MHYSPIARPYALAAFECAKEKQQLAAWQMYLNAAAYIAKQSTVMKLFDNPQMDKDKWFALFSDILAAQLDTERKNFLKLLVEHQRLQILPAIAELFSKYCAQLEKLSNIRVVTAIDTKEGYRQTLKEALMKRIKHNVTLFWEVDPSILGGAVIQIGDSVVIDGSVRGKLARLLEFFLR